MNRKKKRKLKLGNIFIALSLVILFILVIFYGSKQILKKEVKTESNNNGTKEEVKEKVYTTSVITAGDNLIHSSLYNEAHRNANYDGYDFSPMYELLKPIVSNYDIEYYNQETILGGSEIGLSDYPTFNSPYEVGDTMIDLGFNLVSLATNHTIDSGSKAVLNSREYWNSKENVLAVGSYSSEEERNKVDIRESNGITYTMLNYTYGTNGIKVPEEKEYLVNVWPTDLDINDPEKDTEYQDYKKTVLEDIKRVRDKVDVLIVAMHWGREYTHTPTELEKETAKFLASLDVDIIIGTHPHVIQPVEFIDDTLVFYSLGNFISAQYQNQSTCTNYKCMVGLMSSLTITKTVEGDKKEITIDNVENELIYTYYTNWSRFKVIPFSNPAIKEYLPSYQNTYNTYANVIASDDERIKTVPLAE